MSPSEIQGRSPGRGSGGILIVIYCNKFELVGIFISKLKIYTVFRDILSICQLHTLPTRTAQISLELHFCVELHTKKALMYMHCIDSWVSFYNDHQLSMKRNSTIKSTKGVYKAVELS